MNHVNTIGVAVLSVLATTATLPAVPPPGHTDILYALSGASDGKRLISASEDNTAILWDADKLAPHLQLKHDAPVYDARFVPNGKQVVTADGTGKVRVWDATTGKPLRTFDGHKGSIYSLAVSADGKRIAAGGGDDDPTVRAWEFDTGKLIATFEGHTKPVYGVAFHPTKPLLASSSSDGTVRFWDLKEAKHRTLRGHTSHVYRCTFSPDGKWLATASHDKTVRVWNTTTGDTIAVLKGSKEPVYAVAFSSDGKQLAAGGEDRAVRCWAVPEFKLQATLPIPGRKPVFAVMFAPNGMQILAGCGDSRIHRLKQ